MGTDVPYTTVFEKVRATKDGKSANSEELGKPSQVPSRHRLEGNTSMIYPQPQRNMYNNVSPTMAELHYAKRSVMEEGDFRRKASDLQSSSSRRSSLEQIADHIFAESQHAAGSESPVVSRLSTSSNASWQSRQFLGSRELYVKDSRFYQPIVSSGSSGANHQVYQARLSQKSVPTLSPRRERPISNFSVGSHSMHDVSAAQLQQWPLQTNSLSAEMPNRVLPKFGDWDATDPARIEFTVIFDKARNERRTSTVIQDSTLEHKAPSGADEDLYKPNFTHKRRSGIWNLLCCSHSSVS